MWIGTEGSPAAPSSRMERGGRVAGASTVPLQPDARTRNEGAATAPEVDGVELSPQAQEELKKLKARDQEVRAHEAAHMAAGGSLVRGAASYTYQQGKDGKRYAVGGEVSLDASPVPNDPEATKLKAQRIRAAALAPADPSAQDRAVAAQASAMAAQAAAEQARKNGSEAGVQIDLLG